MTPSTKVTAATAAVAVAVIGVWLIEYFGGVDLPTAVEGAAGIVLTFLAGYFVPERNPSPSGRRAVTGGD